MPHLHVIFVYGTLKRGFCRAHFLTDQQFVGEARTLPCYRMYHCGTYPGLQPASDGLSIIGEIWAVDSACLGRLDHEESLADGLFSRRAIHLNSSMPASVCGSKVEAYFYLPSVAGFVDCGVQWLDETPADK